MLHGDALLTACAFQFRPGVNVLRKHTHQANRTVDVSVDVLRPLVRQQGPVQQIRGRRSSAYLGASS
jgi:hypothetical protein